MFCINCGHKLQKSAAFCTSCGNPRNADGFDRYSNAGSPITRKKSKLKPVLFSFAVTLTLLIGTVFILHMVSPEGIQGLLLAGDDSGYEGISGNFNDNSGQSAEMPEPTGTPEPAPAPGLAPPALTFPTPAPATPAPAFPAPAPVTPAPGFAPPASAHATTAPTNPAQAPETTSPASRPIARVNSRYITESDIGYALWATSEALVSEYFAMFPGEWEVNENRVMRDGMTFAEILRHDAIIKVAMNYLMERDAERMGVGLTVENRRNIYRNVYEEWGGGIGDLYVIGITTKDKLRSVIENYEIRSNLINAILDNPVEATRFIRFMQDYEVLAAQHILVAFGSFDSYDAAEIFANRLHHRILAGEDFIQLMLTYCEDPGQPIHGYTFTSGTMVAEFEKGVQSINIGEVSPPIASVFGFHIIRRTEPNMTEIMGGSNPADRIEQAVLEYFRAKAVERVVFK